MFGFRNLVSRFWRGCVVISSSFWCLGSDFSEFPLTHLSVNSSYLKVFFPCHSLHEWFWIPLNSQHFLSLPASFTMLFLYQSPKLVLPLKAKAYKMWRTFSQDLQLIETSNSWALSKVKRHKAWHCGCCLITSSPEAGVTRVFQM